ncbi:MAG: GTP cyclohydrolase II [Candidatus Altimarinota bacterium]
MIHKTAQTILDTEHGTFDFVVYQDAAGKEHMALLKDWGDKVPLVRIHSECATGDLFASQFCDCGQQLEKGLEMIQREGGVMMYLRQEGRGLGLGKKIQAYELQRQGMDTVEANLSLGRAADEREYDLAIEMLKDLGVSSLKLLTNNPAKLEALQKAGMTCVQVPLDIPLTSERGVKYLRTKREKMRHTLSR